MWISEALTSHTQIQHGIERLLCAKRTKFQDLIVADIGPYGKALVLDGRLQVTTGDEYLYHEPIVLVPFCLKETPRKILILGGADGGAANVARKWRTVEQILVVDLDGDVVETCLSELPQLHQGCFEDPRVEMVVMDAKDYLEQTNDQFDVIIGDLTDPTEDGASYNLFTVEFFELVKRHILPGGFFTVQAGSISLVEEPTLHARIHRTLREVFSFVESFASFVPSYGTPLGFCVASDNINGTTTLLETIPPLEVDRRLEKYFDATPQAMDGRFFHGLFGTPRSLRRAIQDESTIYRLKE